jgi:hypothetical protein
MVLLVLTLYGVGAGTTKVRTGGRAIADAGAFSPALMVPVPTRLMFLDLDHRLAAARVSDLSVRPAIIDLAIRVRHARDGVTQAETMVGVAVSGVDPARICIAHSASLLWRGDDHGD